MSDFFSKEENKFFKDYFKKGYSVFNVKNLDSLKYIKKRYSKHNIEREQ